MTYAPGYSFQALATHRRLSVLFANPSFLQSLIRTIDFLQYVLNRPCKFPVCIRAVAKSLERCTSLCTHFNLRSHPGVFPSDCNLLCNSTWLKSAVKSHIGEFSPIGVVGIRLRVSAVCGLVAEHRAMIQFSPNSMRQAQIDHL